jgi:hypothetical protein
VRSEHELTHSGVHTYHTPDCMDLVPVLLTQQSTLQAPLSHKIHKPKWITIIDYLGRVRPGNRLHIRHLPQFPLRLTVFQPGTSFDCAATLYCSNWHYFKLLIMPVPSKLMIMGSFFMLGYWNVRFLHVAYGKIAISNKIYCCCNLLEIPLWSGSCIANKVICVACMLCIRKWSRSLMFLERSQRAQ